MAIYHQHIKVFQRSKGHNVVNAIAYRRGIKLIDPKSGKAYDYSYRKDVVHTEILLPENAPQWIKEIVELDKTDPLEAAKLFSYSIEFRETRKDSQLARETEVALPQELTKKQNLALCRDFAKFFTEQGMVVEIDIHDAHQGKKNPHAHILLSMRELTEQGWGNKVRGWNERVLGQKMRAVWDEIQNRHLAIAGFDIKVSHLSNAARGIDLEPTVHEGNQKNLANQQARERNTKIRLRNLEKILEKPDILLDALAQQSATFSVQDIAQTLGTQLEPANEKILIPDPEPPKSRRVISRVSQFMNAVAPQFFSRPELSSASATAALEVVDPLSITLEPHLEPVEIIQKVLEEITQHEAVFNEKFLTRVLSRHVAHPEVLAQVLMQIKSSPELLTIGPGEDGRERYTTREMFDLENNIQELAEQLNQKAKHTVNGRMINKYIKKFNIDSDQAQAIRHILKGNDITVMVGRAGTGKSYSLKAAKAAWEASDYQVQGIALAGKAADSLENDSGIASRTIESFCTALKSETLKLSAKDIIVMDEAGMTDSLSMLKVLIAVVKSNAKLVLVGDHAQLQPIGPGAIFRALLERLGFAELTTIRRQKEVWQKEATGHFAAGRTVKALEYYERHECISLSDTLDAAKQNLIQDWASAIKTSPLSESLILAYENPQVAELNKLARYHLNAIGALSHPAITRNAAGEIGIAHGERILFLENSWRYGVKNGQLGTIMSYTYDAGSEINAITVLLYGQQNKIVTFNPTQYKKFTHGYAVTIHRSQGTTVDNVFALSSWTWNRH
ncbi:MAG TPA: MobA/MobL family protein, partial [Gammaproteobacteria bacterium]|nr:MobA/MobL family protein [Gammaproteobacteria bacterium]